MMGPSGSHPNPLPTGEREPWYRSTRVQIIFWALMQIPAFAVLELLFRLERPFDPDYVHFDVQIYFNAAKSVLDGQLPYRDFFFPYPAGSLLFFVPPMLASENAVQYQMWFKAEIFLLVLLGLVATAFIGQKIGQPLNRTLLLYTLSIPALGSILWQRYDLVPAFVVLLALAAWVKGWREVAWALLGLGTLVKIYPVLIAPLFALADYRAGGVRRAGRGIAIFSAVVALGFAPFFIASFEETSQIFFAQTGRGFEIESVGASLMMAASWFGFAAQAVYKRRLNTWEADSPVAGGLQILFLGLEAAATLFVYWRFWRAKDANAFSLIRYAGALLALSLLTAKVFSAQFIVWLFPLAVLTGKTKFNVTAVLFLLAGALTQIGFPYQWQELKQAAWLPTGALLVRDASLALLAIMALRHSDKDASSEIAPPSRSSQ